MAAQAAVRHGEVAAAARIARSVQSEGYARMSDVVSSGWLSAARHYASTVNRLDTNEVLLEGLTAEDAVAVDDLLSDTQLRDFLESVALDLHPDCNPLDRHLDVSIRIINGPDPADAPLWFHYDATVVTMVIPVDIPDAGPGLSGELVLFPNRRPFRRFATTNIVEKMVMQSNAYRRRVNSTGATTVVPLEPGSAYVFSGYRSYHATMPCPAGMRRVTILLHYKDAHSGSQLLRGAKSLYHRIFSA
jgi:hypothetical protein